MKSPGRLMESPFSSAQKQVMISGGLHTIAQLVNGGRNSKLRLHFLDATVDNLARNDAGGAKWQQQYPGFDWLVSREEAETCLLLLISSYGRMLLKDLLQLQD